MKLPRLSGWLIATLVLLLAILAFAPQQLPVSLYKLSLVSMAGVAGYWLDRELFPYARPDSYLSTTFSPGVPFTGRTVAPGHEVLYAAAMIRRAIIVGAAMLAVGLGA